MEISLGKLILIIILISIGGCCLKFCGSVENVVDDEFNAKRLLEKYEWFKNASAQLDSKRSNLGIYEQRFQGLKDSYGKDSLSRSDWQRDDREQWNIWQSEYLGIKANYNDLAAEYNAAMAKFNYAFCNVGSLPQGAEFPLPREFKPYIGK